MGIQLRHLADVHEYLSISEAEAQGGILFLVAIPSHLADEELGLNAILASARAITQQEHRDGEGPYQGILAALSRKGSESPQERKLSNTREWNRIRLLADVKSGKELNRPRSEIGCRFGTRHEIR